MPEEQENKEIAPESRFSQAERTKFIVSATVIIAIIVVIVIVVLALHGASVGHIYSGFGNEL